MLIGWPWSLQIFFPLSFDLPVFSVSASNSLSLLKHSESWRKYFTSPLLAKKASWGFSMSQWSSEESKVASISLKMGDSTFTFMTSATCHLQIVFGRVLYVVLLVSCFVHRVGENMQYLFKKCCPYGIGNLLFYIVSPPSQKKSQNISTSKKNPPCHPTNSLALLLGLTSGMSFFMVDMP